MSLHELKLLFDTKINKINDSKALEALRIEFIGKNGLLTEQMKKIGLLPVEEKKTFGAEVNKIRDEITSKIEEFKRVIESKELEERLLNEAIDITLPARSSNVARIHPISKVIYDLKAIFSHLGFEVASGAEIEDEWHNFTALNVDENHPARQMQDTFYLEDRDISSLAFNKDTYTPNERFVLRTHTSSMQIRYMKSNKPPIKMISLGKVYRSDFDATHTPMFHQIEGLYIDKNIDMGHLKGCLKEFLRLFFEINDAPIRLRPSFFPFTEPSAEVDVKCDRSDKNSIKFGTGEDWLEILGAGMVHPNVLKNVGIDPDEYQGFAFGAGIERLAMLKYNIPDLRKFFDGDIRWLKHYGFLGY